MEKRPLLLYSFSDLQNCIKEMGLEAYRAKQIWEWLYQKQVFDFTQMTNLSQIAREKLVAHFGQVLAEPVDCQSDEDDGTKKLVLELADGCRIECVGLPDTDSLTFCLSSQVGCKAKCVFCRTGTGGFKRHLTDVEILYQYFSLTNAYHRPPTNIVFMGMGEPFFNTKNVFSAIEVLTDKKGMNLATRRITISTVGIPDGIYALSEMPGEVNLAVSLHAADEETRGRMIPIHRKYPLHALRRAIEDYITRTSRRVTFEIVLIKGLNDGVESAMNLVSFCEGLLCHVNVLRFNPFPGCVLRPSSEEAEKEFRKHLKKAGIPVTIRKSRGSSILAACGQLLGE
jgi:23S rRNA (adenine2503-C2)-methyltransferase